MNETTLFKGVVSAYDTNSKKAIFTGLHNVVTTRGKLFMLRQILAISDISESDIYIPADVQDIKTSPGIVMNMDCIFYFKAGYTQNANFPIEYTDSPDFGNSPLFLLSWFDGTEGYDVSDIIPNDFAPLNMTNKKILYTKEGGAFIRFKLHLSGGPHNTSPRNGLGVPQGSSKDINLIGLCDSEGRLITQFRFPTITFYSDTSVDFEYRLYV